MKTLLHQFGTVEPAALASASPILTPARPPLLWHVVLPGAVMLVLLAFFFSGVPELASLVAHHDNRELGLLEHLQMLPLVAVAALAIAARRREQVPPWRWLWTAVAAGALFVALEELNYGQHHLALLLSTGSEAEVGPISVHNTGDLTDVFKLVADLGIAILFVALPLLRRYTGRAPLGPVTPHLWYLMTVALLVMLGQVPHLLSALERSPGWMTYNLSEFRELLIYYIGALYMWDLTRARRGVVGESAASTSQAATPPLLRR